MHAVSACPRRRSFCLTSFRLSRRLASVLRGRRAAITCLRRRTPAVYAVRVTTWRRHVARHHSIFYYMMPRDVERQRGYAGGERCARARPCARVAVPKMSHPLCRPDDVRQPIAVRILRGRCRRRSAYAEHARACLLICGMWMRYASARSGAVIKSAGV
jgi:hypothetical protein